MMICRIVCREGAQAKSQLYARTRFLAGAQIPPQSTGGPRSGGFGLVHSTFLPTAWPQEGSNVFTPPIAPLHKHTTSLTHTQRHTHILKFLPKAQNLLPHSLTLFFLFEKNEHPLPGTTPQLSGPMLGGWVYGGSGWVYGGSGVYGLCRGRGPYSWWWWAAGQEGCKWFGGGMVEELLVSSLFSFLLTGQSSPCCRKSLPVYTFIHAFSCHHCS